MDHQIKIIVVEDDKLVRGSLYDSLYRLYDSIVLFENGYEAKEYLENNLVDIVITDINMPRINGFGNGADLVEYIVSRKDIDIIPIVITSAYHKISCQYKDFKCISVVNKPINTKELVKEISRLTELRRIHKCGKEVFESLDRININTHRLIKLIKEEEGQ